MYECAYVYVYVEVYVWVWIGVCVLVYGCMYMCPWVNVCGLGGCMGGFECVYPGRRAYGCGSVCVHIWV